MRLIPLNFDTPSASGFVRKILMTARALPLVLVFGVVSNVTFASEKTPLVLKFGLYATDKPSVLVKQFRPILDLLQIKVSTILGRPVTIRSTIVNSYEQGQDDIVSGAVDFSRLGPATYIAVKERDPGVQIIAMESIKGKKVFYGIICVPTDSPITQLKELAGTRFAFGNKSSTIGRYLSQLMLAKHNIKASNLMAFEYLGRHDKVGAAVAAKTFDAGALKESTFNAQVKKGFKIREIARMENVTKPWVSASKLPAHVFRALQQGILDIEDKKALKYLRTDRLLIGHDSDFDLIREAMSQNYQFFN